MVSNMSFNPDDILLDIELADKNTQAKLTQSGLEAEYNCRMSKLKIGDSKYEDIRLSLIQKER